MKLVMAGTPDVALPTLDALLASPRHELVAVVTRSDAPAGRGRSLTASPVKRRALEAGLEVLTPHRPSEPEFLDRLRALAPDCCPVVAYGALVPRAALDIPPHGWVNLHFSVLPAWRGAAPVQRAILAGDDITGASTFLLEEGLDTGPVYGVVTTAVKPDHTAGALLRQLSRDGADLLVATLDGIEDGTLVAVAQPAEGVSLAPKLTTEDAHVDWTKPAGFLDRQSRACTPAPGTWTRFRGRRVGLARLIPHEVDLGLSPGEIQVGAGVFVGTGSMPVRLTEVQPEGRRAMVPEDWARGARLSAGDRFE